MKTSKQSWLEIVGVFLIVVVFKLLFDLISHGGFTYPYDSAILSYIGHAWSDGVIPYRDLFDHKGPLLFLFHAIGATIYRGIPGIFMVTAINLTAVFYLILCISRIILKNTSNKIHYLVVFAAQIYFLLMREVAALSEELSLLFIFIPLYLLVKFIDKGTDIENHPLKYSFIYGACFAAIAMIRINNAPLNVGIVVGFIILLIQNKIYKALFKNALFCLLGFCSVIIPFVLYFQYHDALYEMIYATFIINLKYKLASSPTNMINNILLLIPCFYLIIISILYDKKTGSIYRYFLIPASITCILAYVNGYTFYHYFVNVLPFFILSLLLSYILFKRSKVFFTLLIGVLFLLPRIEGAVEVIKTPYRQIVARDLTFTNEISEAISIIPQDEYDSVYSYNGLYGFQDALIKNGIYTEGKYFVLNNFHYSFDQKVRDEQDLYHKTTDVKWIIIFNNNGVISRSESFTNLIKKYDLVYSEHNREIYRRSY